MRRCLIPFSFFCVALCSPAAWADVPPPDGYVETCTIQDRQDAGESCVDCFADFSNPDHCADTVGTQGYTHECRAWGGSAWSEVWCRADAAEGTGEGAPTPDGGEPSEEESSLQGELVLADAAPSCNVTPTLGNAAGAGFCGLLAVGAVLMLRRRQDDDR